MKRILTEDRLLVGPKLSKSQWQFLATSVRTFGDGILLGTAAAFFLPEAFQQTKPIPPDRFVFLLFSGLLAIALSVILIKRSDK